MRFGFQHPQARGLGKVVADLHAAREALESRGIGNALHLYPVRAGMRESRIREPVLQLAVIGEQQQTFTIVIETACGVHTLHANELGERAALAAELRDDAVGFVE